MPAHYLRVNERQWSPRVVGILDTETTPEEVDGGQLHRLRLWCMSVVDRRPARPGDRARVTYRGHTGDELVAALDDAMRGRRSVWVYAHNLTFDLSTTRIVDRMSAAGWSLADISLVGKTTKAQLRRGDRHLWLLDSWSILPESLDAIGTAVGVPKLPLPAFDAPDDEWFARCQVDVEVLERAMLDLMSWWDAAGLGSFSRTGPASGWNAMRHMMRRKAVVVSGDEDDRKADRLAIRGGRRDTTRVGKIIGGPFALLDFRHAYASVMEHCRLPAARVNHAEHFDAASITDPRSITSAIAECRIWTEAPRWPVTLDGVVLYPVGQFHTVLAGPEIEEAQRLGDLVSIGRGQRHRMDRGMSDFGRWVTDRLASGQQLCPPVAGIAIHQWGRSVPGKFAARTSRTVDLGQPNWSGTHVERGTYGFDHQPYYDVVAGGRHFGLVRDVESEESYPAVLAFIESAVRVALTRTLESLGEHLWVTADTDGLFVDLAYAPKWLREHAGDKRRYRSPATMARALCEALAPVSAPLIARPKLIAQQLEIAGPQHLRADGYVRAAGRPKVETDPATGRQRMLTWPSMTFQASQGHRDGYLRTEASWTDPGLTVARWVLPDGRCIPPRLGITPDGRNVLVPWERDLRSHELGPLADHQSPAMERLASRYA